MKIVQVAITALAFSSSAFAANLRSTVPSNTAKTPAHPKTRKLTETVVTEDDRRITRDYFSDQVDQTLDTFLPELDSAINTDLFNNFQPVKKEADCRTVAKKTSSSCGTADVQYSWKEMYGLGVQLKTVDRSCRYGVEYDDGSWSASFTLDYTWETVSDVDVYIPSGACRGSYEGDVTSPVETSVSVFVEGKGNTVNKVTVYKPDINMEVGSGALDDASNIAGGYSFLDMEVQFAATFRDRVADMFLEDAVHESLQAAVNGWEANPVSYN